MDKETLLLYTYSYPYGTGEQFLELELSILSKYYEKIILVPSLQEQGKRELKEANVHIAELPKGNSIKVDSNFFLQFRIFIYELLFSKQRLTYLKNIRYYLAYLRGAETKAENLFTSIIEKYPNAINYTYWFNEITLQLSILKHKNKIDRVITRGHGGDIYEYQHKEKNYIFPFRFFQLKQLDVIATASLDGASYLKNKYGAFNKKIVVSYLACKQFERGETRLSDRFTILSCSSFFDYKRIPFLIETLKHCKAKIHWVHIGDSGDEKEIAMEAVKYLPENISHEWTGFLNTEDVSNYYKKNYFDAFINVSSSEGLPVSLMEAISCGMPIIATDVGGVREITNKETGVLVDKNISATNLSKLLDNIADHNIKLPDPDKIIKVWENNFSVNNYHLFYKNVLCAE